MGDKESALVIEMAKQFMVLMGQISPDWQKAFFRFSFSATQYGSVASFIDPSSTTLLDPFRHAGFFEFMNQKSSMLASLIGKPAGVLLLTIQNTFDYQIQFDFSQPDRWRITKLNGGTGIPEGL